MSQENVEILRRGYEQFNRTGEFDPDRWDADAVFDNSNAVFADPGVYRGFDRIRRFFDAQGEMWTSQRYEPQEFIAVGADQVVVPQEIVSVGRDGVEVVARVTILWTLRAGKVTQLRNFQTKAEALEAAELGRSP
jgi:ketosteroid isomerase-like protein